MINVHGRIQNSSAVSELLRNLKKDKENYGILTKEKEREIIESYVTKKLDENGNEMLNTETREYEKYINCKDEVKKQELFYYVPRVFEWHKDEDELRNILISHNIRYVFNLSKKHNKDTVDFDNMIARGLYGLVIASTRFNYYRPLLEYDKTNPLYNTDRKNCPKIPKLDENGKVHYVKFNTSACCWIFKYLMKEFMEPSILIDNNSISINDVIRIKNTCSEKNTIENYIDSKVSPDYSKPKGIVDELSSNDINSFYDKVGNYIKTTNELTSVEKDIVYGTFFEGKTISDLASKFNMNIQNAQTKKKRALTLIKYYLQSTYGIKNMNDIVEG